MKRTILLLITVLTTIASWSQGVSALDQLKADPRKSYGTDYPYTFTNQPLTKAPKGYKPFYISHYGRHGSRYYWNAMLYQELGKLLPTAHEKQWLTAEGEAFYKKFMAAKDELTAGVSELSDLGWEQHQRIARTMYNNFPEVFKRGGNVLAISSLTGRCVLSMSAFCQELVQCNPKIEIREQSARKTLNGVVPTDNQNPLKRKFRRDTARWEKNRDKFQMDESLRDKVVKRVFANTDSLHNLQRIGSNLINLYTSLPNIGHEGMMGNLITDDEMAAQWEQSNLGSYSWVFEPQYEMIPILEDIIEKADAVIEGRSDHIADLRFGHDTCLGPLTVLMGINGADLDPENPYEVKNCYQNWQTGKASNIQLVFYRKKVGDYKSPTTDYKSPTTSANDILVKLLLNGVEARLPIATDCFPYYRWSALRQFYQGRVKSEE